MKGIAGDGIRRFSAAKSGAGFALLLCVLLGACQRPELHDVQTLRDGNRGDGSLESGFEEHPHIGDAAGRAISTLGRDEYHAEAILTSESEVTVLVLDADETRLYQVPDQSLTAYFKVPGENRTSVALLEPAPLEGDRPGMTSRFIAQLPEPVRGQPLQVTLAGLRIEEQRFVARFDLPAVPSLDSSPEMPAGVADRGESEQLYLTAGGNYTSDDIKANGSMTAGDKYRGFQPQHDPNPAPGDLICPITRTKANTECKWIVGGKTHYFCCPPCIDEFLREAKQSTQMMPDEHPPEASPAR